MYNNENDLDDDNESYIPTELKVVVIGVSGVGKTSLCVRYVHDEFQDFSPTIGASFLQKNCFNWKLSIMFTNMGYSRTRTISCYDTVVLSKCESCDCSI